MGVYAYVGITLAVLMSLVALIVAISVRRISSLTSVRRRCSLLELELVELRSNHDSLVDRWRSFRSAEGMRELRLRRRGGPDSELPDPPRGRAPGDSKAPQRKAMGVPDNPIQAVLKNVAGEFSR